MGEFTKTYGEDSWPSDGDPEFTIPGAMIAAAINQGYTPSGIVSMKWNPETKCIKATLPVEERTQDGH
jgi:hypothetical protein